MNDIGLCPCCDKPMTDYAESLGSLVCKSCGFMLCSTQREKLKTLQRRVKENNNE